MTPDTLNPAMVEADRMEVRRRFTHSMARAFLIGVSILALVAKPLGFAIGGILMVALLKFVDWLDETREHPVRDFALACGAAAFLVLDLWPELTNLF